jgi:DNA-binding NarL/FixJ family response regulator
MFWLMLKLKNMSESVRMKLLIADDNPEVRSALRLLLEQEPLQALVEEASDTQSVLAHLSDSCPMAILLDWELPGLHKNGVLHDLRTYCQNVKIIALSSKYEARREALAIGVDAFVSKTEPPEQILTTLCSLIRGSHPNAPTKADANK